MSASKSPGCVIVCTTCKRHKNTPEMQAEAGQELTRALQQAAAGKPVQIVETECLGACDFGCNAAVTSAGKYHYVYRNLDASHGPALVTAAALLREKEGAELPYRERPKELKGHMHSRIPPLPQSALEGLRGAPALR